MEFVPYALSGVTMARKSTNTHTQRIENELVVSMEGMLLFPLSWLASIPVSLPTF